MQRVEFGGRAFFPLILGVLLGTLGTVLCLFPQVFSAGSRQQESGRGNQALALKPVAERRDWPPAEYELPSEWVHLKVDETGWTAHPVGTFQDLNVRLEQLDTSRTEIAIPIFPSVYTPRLADKLYYDAVLESEIEPGDKVLVIGTGSGADAWVAWLKTQSLVYVVDVNPMAIVNARATALFANFPIRPVLGDIREVELPDDFSEFEFVLWNMPFLDDGSIIESRDFHDGDDGSILTAFLNLLPSLLKDDGMAIILNYSRAADFIKSPGVTTKSDGRYMVFVIPNPKKTA